MRRMVALHPERFGFESCDRNFLLFVIVNYNFHLKSLFCLYIVYGLVVILMLCCKVFHAVSMTNCLLENIST